MHFVFQYRIHARFYLILEISTLLQLAAFDLVAHDLHFYFLDFEPIVFDLLIHVLSVGELELEGFDAVLDLVLEIVLLILKVEVLALQLEFNVIYYRVPVLHLHF